MQTAFGNVWIKKSAH